MTYSHGFDTLQIMIGEERAEKFQFSGFGEIYSYSIVRFAPTDFAEFAPYIVALVKLDEGPLVTAQITDLLAKEIGGINIIGMRVEMVTRVLTTHGERGVIKYGFKFRPIDLV